MDTISSLWDILNDINVNNISGVVVISFFYNYSICRLYGAIFCI